MEIGNIIKDLRMEKKLTQPELAKLIGVANSVISNWELNKNIPRADYVCELAKVFETSTDFIMGRANDEGYIIVQELPLPRDERRLINYYKDLPDKLKTAILEHAKTIYELNNNNLNTYDKRSN